METGRLEGVQPHRRTLDDRLTLKAQTADLDECEMVKDFFTALVQLAKGQWQLHVGAEKLVVPKAAPKKRSRGRPEAVKAISLQAADGRPRTILWDLSKKIRSLERDGGSGVEHAKLRL